MKKVEITGINLVYSVGQVVELSDYKADILISEGKAKLAEHIDNLETKTTKKK
jgi:hypothetical protein